MEPLTLDQLFQDAKSKAQLAPGDIRARSALWQIFAARGEHDRARKQLDLMVQLDSSWALEVQACHGLLTAEAHRLAVFRGEAIPACLGEPPAWFAKLVAALPMVAAGQHAAAIPLLREAQDEAGASPGMLNKSPFEWLCDGDARLGPCLEVIVQGRYFWAPWRAIRSLVSRPPSEVRDRLWQPAMIEVTDEGPIEVFIPVRYPEPRDDGQALARRTDWEPLNDELYIGRGQKCLLTDGGESGFLDIRELRFD